MQLAAHASSKCSLHSEPQPVSHVVLVLAAASRVIRENILAAQQILPIVPAQVIELTLNPEHSKFTGYAPGTYAALRMPHYCGSVASLLQFPEEAVVRGGLRMKSALHHTHSLGLVHMDVKVRICSLLRQSCWCC